MRVPGALLPVTLVEAQARSDPALRTSSASQASASIGKTGEPAGLTRCGAVSTERPGVCDA